MRYSETHKEETHAKLLKLASKALREKGPDQIVIADVMSAAGLTHGGFYAHFSSKDAFLSESLASAFAHSSGRISRLVEGLPPRDALSAYIDHYVSAAHRDDPATGCPISALSSDLPRQPRRFQAAFDKGVKAIFARLESWMEAANVPDAGALAPSIFSAMAGAVTLSRAISDRKLSDEILEAARTGIKARLGLRNQRETAMNVHVSDTGNSATLSGYERMRRVVEDGLPFGGIGPTLGFRLVEVEEGRAVFEGTPTPAHFNPMGFVHGGYAATMLDSAVGCAVLSRLKAGQRFTTLELKIAYHRAVTDTTGPVRAEGTVVTLGRRTGYAEGKLVDASGKLLASATSTLLILPQ
jgi:uncharacterized protein (TIGR00369 family)